MKNTAVKMLLTQIGTFVLMAITVTGCMKTASPGPTGPSSDEYFGFETRSNVQLTVDYGQPGFQAQFQLFAENPLTTVKDEETGKDVTLFRLKEGVQAIFTAYTDKDGKFNSLINLPSAAKTVYLFTDRLGVSSCVELDMSAGGASYIASMGARSTRTTTSASEMEAWFPGKAPFALNIGQKYDNTRNVRALYKWTTNGVLDGVNSIADVYTTPSVNGSTIAAISERTQEYLNGIPMGAERAKLLIKDPNTANVTTKVNGTKLQVVYLDERAAYTNTFGYYYYKKSNTNYTKPVARYFQEDMNNLQKYIIFPHAASAALNVGTTAQLQFFGEKGDKAGTYEFPADYVVGWFLIGNGFITENNNIHIQQYRVRDEPRANDPSPASNQWGMLSCSNDLVGSTIDFRRFITLYDKSSQSLVIGVEDIRNERTPDDYCDLSFIITSNNPLDNPDLPEIPDVPVKPKIDNTFFGTLAFEDIWPNGGDYDMNDVVVEYKWKITFDKDNKATELEETYTPVHNGAGLRDLFAYQLPYGTVSNNSDVTIETATSSIIINACIKDALHKPVVIKRTFSSPIDKEKLKEAFNPFIIVDDTKIGPGRKEVHLPKKSPTDYADKALNQSGDDAFYVHKAGQYPFAINIPILDFVVATEKVKIDDEYPGFRLWADSNGKTNTDWYLSKKK